MRNALQAVPMILVVGLSSVLTAGCGLVQLVELGEDMADGGARQLLPEEMQVFPHSYKWLCATVVRQESDAGSLACFDDRPCIEAFRAEGHTEVLGCRALGCEPSPVPPGEVIELTALMEGIVPCVGK